MRFGWSFELSEIEAAKGVVEDRLSKGRRALISRQRKNVERESLVITRDHLWFTHLMCLLTSVQRSGPGSPVDQFLSQQPFPLSLSICQQAESVETLTYDCLKRIGGIRFTSKIPKQTVANFRKLESAQGWDELLAWKDRLLALHREVPDPSHYEVETQAAQFLQQHFMGFGPKQSRNFWQSLGLTRFSLLLDSRVIRWLRENLDLEAGLLTSQGLNDEAYYGFISRILIDLCNQAAVLPCMFDAAVFDSYDTAEWTTDSPW
jgi:hypothetical protein